MSERLVLLRRGFAVPLSAIEAASAIEHAGHRIVLDGDDLLIETHGPVNRHDLDQLRKWKPDVRMLLAHTPSDCCHRSAVAGAGVDQRPLTRGLP